MHKPHVKGSSRGVMVEIIQSWGQGGILQLMLKRGCTALSKGGSVCRLVGRGSQIRNGEVPSWFQHRGSEKG